ncbi:hypothetical protein TNCV_4119781 [Trichonephila clavipes]|nr:hypothetical protein TNCV_4119781 [Trichonephila clavipes]
MKDSCESLIQVGLLHDRWCDTTNFHLHNLGLDWGGGKHSPAPSVFAATTHKTLRPTDLTSTCSVCTRKIFGCIGHRTHALQSGVRFSITIRLPTETGVL